jgi:hypothetical protein
VIPRHLPGLVVKLRSCRVRMPVEAAVDSSLYHMDPHHFATGLVAPSPTTEFSTTIKGGSNIPRFHVLFPGLVVNCDLSGAQRQAKKVTGRLFSIHWHMPETFSSCSLCSNSDHCKMHQTFNHDNPVRCCFGHYC